MTKVAVLDYGIGNLRSAQKALEHVGADARLTADLAEIEAADGVVLPGVGAFRACMDALRESGLDRPVWVYFVHSYAAELHDGVVATCSYGGDVVAAVERDRLWATQFHPEKSGAAGLGMLSRFVESLG